jgi:PAS domain S-box-containing protein
MSPDARTLLDAARLEAILASVPAAVAVLEGPEHRFVFANPSYAELVAGRDLDGRTVREALPEVAEQGFLELLDHVYATGEPHHGSETPVFLDGDDGRYEVVLDFVYLPMRDAAGAVNGILLHAVDVTEAVQSRRIVEALADQQRRAALLVEGNNALLELVATGAPLPHTLERLVQMLEQHAGGEMLGSILLLDRDGVHLRHGAAPSLPDPYNEAIDGIEIGPSVGSCGTAAFRAEPVVVADIDTDPLWAEFRELALAHGLRACWSTPIFSSAEEVLGTFAMYYRAPRDARDDDRMLVEIATRTAAVAIERKRLEEDRERRARAVISLEHVTDGVCLVDDDGVVLVWNPAAAAIAGIDGGSIVGTRLSGHLPAFADIGERARSLAGSRPADTVHVRLADRELWLAVSATAFDGGVVYTFRDRTAEHRLEELRSEIVATVSHELRTPLAAVYGAAQTLGRSDVTDVELREQLLAMIVEETQRLTRVADQILQTSDLEARHLDSTVAAVDVERLSRRVVDLAAARSGRVAVELDVPDGALVLADEDRLQQVLSNLVDNALKYGAAGGRVLLRAAVESDRVRIAVVDWGPGVPPSEAAQVFDRFYRLDPDQQGGVAGAGLGLYICRELVRQMGGEIWVEPTPGGGATFVVDLAVARERVDVKLGRAVAASDAAQARHVRP